MDTRWLQGKKVAIVDEALVSGSTLWKVHRHLQSIGAAPTIHVFYVNRETFNPEILALAPGYLELSDRDSAIISTSMVRAMSVVPRPYSVDYPLYVPIELRSDDAPALWSHPLWRVSDCSTGLQRDCDVFVLTVEPTPKRLSAFQRLIGMGSQLNALYKIRIYGRVSNKGKVIIRLVPMIILGPLYRETVDELFDSLVGAVDASPTGPTPREWFSSSTSRLSAVQYVLSHRLAELWSSDIAKLLSRTFALVDDVREMQLLFAPEAIRSVQDAIASLKTRIVSCELFSVSLPSSIDLPLVPEGLDGLSITYGMNYPFAWLYEHREKTVRRHLLTTGKAALEREINAIGLDRLEQGFSLDELLAWANSFLGDGIDPCRVVSHFLDLAIDEGIVVPITAKRTLDNEDGERDVIFRAYRHGEEAHLSTRNLKLAAALLIGLSEQISEAALPRIDIEKLLVLFIRFGAQKRFIEPPSMDSQSVLAVTYDKFGAVVKQGSDSFVAHSDSDSLARILVNAGVIEDSASKDRKSEQGYKLAVAMPWTRDDIENTDGYQDAVMAGYLLGQVFGDGKGVWSPNEECTKLSGQLNDEEVRTDVLTLIATCDTAEHTALALAAEIAIFSRVWARNNTALRYKQFKSKAELVEFRSENFFRTVNSGQWKYRKWRGGESQEWARRIRECLERMSRHIWDSYQEQLVVGGAEDKKDRVLTLIQGAGNWCLSVFALYLIWEYWAYFVFASSSERDEHLRAISRSRTLIKSARGRFSHPKEWTAVYDSKKGTIALPEALANKERIFTHFERYVVEGRSIFSEVQALISPGGRVNNILPFRSAARISLNPIAGEEENVLETVHELLDEITGRVAQHKPTKRVQALLQAPEKGKKSWCIVFERTGMTWDLFINGSDEDGWLAYIVGEFYSRIDAKISATILIGVPKELAPYQVAPRSGVVAHYYEHFLGAVSLEEEGKGKITLVSPKSFDVTRVMQIVQTTLRRKAGVLYEDVLDGKMVYNVLVAVKRSVFGYEAESVRGISEVVMSETVDVGLITILPDEAAAAKTHLKQYYPIKRIPGRISKDRYEIVKVPSSDGGVHSVVLARAVREGNLSIINVASRIQQEFNPKLLVVLGLGGSIHEKHHAGDVLFVTDVHYYEGGKDTEEGLQRRLRAWQVPAPLLARIGDYFEDRGGDEITLTCEEASFGAKRGIIGSGEKVLANEDSEIRTFLGLVNDKTYQVDMESGGVASFAHEVELLRDSRLKGVLVIRGASDKADKLKDDSTRVAAVKNATCAFVDFLSSLDKGLEDL
ncbi:nucleoside phosphorylase [Thiocystis violascens DSM 198]|uniref:Nucleoside phosphorylase n=2 Tax=Thiocystis violascens TaxID=73141 RepID=I3Y926_THIV6|nr:nucleoside phosphorylase [Thiocystis violascens DSM 198]